jgi:Fungal protein kinase
MACLEGVPSKNQHPTGTWLFMASDLLLGEGPLEHLYKHNAESFFWVAVYDSALDSSSVHQWGNLDNTTLLFKKSAYIYHGTAVIPMDGK